MELTRCVAVWHSARVCDSFLNRNYVLKRGGVEDQVASCHQVTRPYTGRTSRGRGRAQEYNRSAVERQNHISIMCLMATKSPERGARHHAGIGTE